MFLPLTAETRRPGLDLTRPATVRAVARRAGLHLSQRLGQHFLVDRDVLDAAVAALEPLAGQTVIEIGAGIGTLTGALAARAVRVIALDVDPGCVAAAAITQRGVANVIVVRADARHLDPTEFGVTGVWLAAGNLPYRLTGVLLSRLFELAAPPRRGVFLVQREVAARLTAGSGAWSLATLALRSIAGVERVRDVAPASFLPPPAVHSSLIRVTPAPALSPADRERLLSLARRVFQQRRKTLRHGVAHALGGDATLAQAALREARLEPGVRPGTLGIDEWTRLAAAVAAVTDAGA